MVIKDRNTLTKAERLHKKKEIDMLFSGVGKSISSFPLKLVYLTVERDENELPASLLVSVPKKKFKRAVKRNRIKRQIREAYRKSKHTLVRKLYLYENKRILLAFIFLDNKLRSSDVIEGKINILLDKILDGMEKNE